MKKLFLSTILFVGLAAAGFSQEKPQRAQRSQDKVQHVQQSPEQRAQKSTDALVKRLSLTSDQKSQIYQINLERAQAINSFKSTKRGDRSQMKAQFDASENRILSVLTANQKSIYNQLKTERQSKIESRQNGRKKEVRNKKV